MNNSSYPALLNKRARILASLNRTDLIVVGTNYLILSQLKISAITILIISGILLVVTKILTRKLEKGFVENIFSRRIINWHQKIGGVNE
jgi:hypothetical protein